MKKRLAIHIGSHKTATTFLQNSFAINQPVLDQLGILYPKAGRIYGAHHQLAWAVRKSETAGDPLTSLDHWPALVAEATASPHDLVVISSEDFEWIGDIARLAALREWFDVSVIFYLRSSDSYLESYYNQMVKDFGTREVRTLEEYITESSLFFLETTVILNRWAEVFGRESINLRLFGKAHLPDGIEYDFLRTLGLTGKPVFKPAELSVLHKVSLPPDALEYLRLCNPYLTRSEGHHDFVVQLVQMATERADDLQKTRCGILSLDAKRNILRRFRQSNRQAMNLYRGIDRVPFPVDEAKPHPDFQGRLAVATTDIMAKVAVLAREAQ